MSINIKSISPVFELITVFNASWPFVAPITLNPYEHNNSLAISMFKSLSSTNNIVLLLFALFVVILLLLLLWLVDKVNAIVPSKKR